MKELNANYSDEFILSLSILLEDMKLNENTLKLIGINILEIIKTRQYICVKNILPFLLEQEAIYLALQLLGNKICSYTNTLPDELAPLARALVDKFEELSAITINNKEELSKSILSHLKSSWPRYYYGISPEGLSVLNEIMKSNPTIYELAKDSCSQLKEFIKFPVNEMEIAYLALYFSSYIQQSYCYKNKMRILVVCLNGISTGNILKWEISKLLPCAKVIGVEAKPSKFSLRDICDLVISTVPLKSDVPVEVVNARLSDEDRIRLLNRAKAFGTRRNPVNQLNLQELLSIIGRYVDSQKLAFIKRDIIRELGSSEKSRSLYIEGHKNGGILCHLSPSKIVTADKHIGWKEALQYSAEPLIKNGSIETDYIKQICAQIESLRFYMFLMPGLVLAHGRPEMGVNDLDISIGIFKKPVFFDDHHQASVVIVLCPIDCESHMDIIKDIMTVFKDQDSIETLTELNSSLEIINRIEELLGEDDQ
jgi:mannitol/fructose-specific phosphotransferase system IIA component (Ntr-type)/galactitol-specific phosphotransferase system IIB component